MTIVKEAERVRRIREAEEAGRRQKEMRARAAASNESTIKETRINSLVDRIEERHSSKAAIASELVHGFLLPEVQRQADRRLNALEESKFSNASRRALAHVVDTV